ncbi:hypothetical protein ACS0PU_002810 [Formica fusca]
MIFETCFIRNFFLVHLYYEQLEHIIASIVAPAILYAHMHTFTCIHTFTYLQESEIFPERIPRGRTSVCIVQRYSGNIISYPLSNALSHSIYRRGKETLFAADVKTNDPE